MGKWNYKKKDIGTANELGSRFGGQYPLYAVQENTTIWTTEQPDSLIAVLKKFMLAMIERFWDTLSTTAGYAWG